MTFTEVMDRLSVTWCPGGCGLSEARHRQGIAFLEVVHWADRRMSRRALRNLLLIVARMDRESDPGYLNDPVYDWLYLALDSLVATKMARSLHVALPSRLFDRRRRECRALATRRSIHLTRYPRVYEWLNRGGLTR